MANSKNYVDFSSPRLWVILAIAFIFIYIVARRKGAPKLIDVIDIVKDYIGVYVSKWDIAFYIVVPIFLAIATTFEKAIDKDMADLLCVVISILAAAVISFMAMTSDKYDSVDEKEEKNVTDKRQKRKCMESLAIGLLEILLSIVLLVLLFIRPIFESVEWINWILSVVIYGLFYQFLFNILIMMRRLRQIYSKK